MGTLIFYIYRIASANFEENFFSHVFLDEAGHAVEPEAIVPLSRVISVDPMEPTNSTQVVLAGDPQQLGPVLRSPFAIKYGLGI